MSSLRRMLMANAMRGGSLSQEVLQYAASFGDTVLNALKDYCNVHKELIPYINDWKYVIHSLVGTGQESFIVPDGVAYISTDLYNYDSIRLRYIRISGSAYLGARGNAGGATSYGFESSNGIYVYLKGKSYAQYKVENVNFMRNRYVYDVYFDNKKCEVSNSYGEKGVIDYDNNYIEMTLPICLFALRTSPTVVDTRRATSKVAFFKFTDNNANKVAHFIPYYADGEYGMLDIVSLRFYKNDAGEGGFSWELADKVETPPLTNS